MRASVFNMGILLTGLTSIVITGQARDGMPGTTQSIQTIESFMAIRDTNKLNETGSGRAMQGIQPMEETGTDLSLQAEKTEVNRVQLTWKPLSDNTAESYELQRSPDGVIWQTIQTRFRPSDGSLNIPFHFTDAEPDRPLSYYRLRLLMADGMEKFSSPSEVEFLDESAFSISPNPASNFAYMHLYALKEGNAQLIITDRKGKVRHLMPFHVDQGKNEIYLGMLKQLGKGLYGIKVILNKEETLTSSLVVLK